MIRSDQILSTVAMIQEEKLDVRAVTLGVSLLDCRGATPGATAEAVDAKLRSVAGDLVAVCEAASERFGVPITNKRLAVTPVAHIAAGFAPADLVSLARALDDAAASLGVDLLGGFSANVENGTTSAAEAWIESLPEALAVTRHVCASVQVGTTRHGLNMDAVGRVAVAIKRMAERTSGEGGFAAAKFVVFMNQPDDNPFMAGAIHGLGQPDAVINIGVSGPGVIARAVERRLAQPGDAPQLQDLAEEIKRTVVPGHPDRRADRALRRRSTRAAVRQRRPLARADARCRRQRRRDHPAARRRRGRRARDDRDRRDAERRGQEGRRVRELERRRALGRVPARLRGSRARHAPPRMGRSRSRSSRR